MSFATESFDSITFKLSKFKVSGTITNDLQYHNVKFRAPLDTGTWSASSQLARGKVVFVRSWKNVVSLNCQESTVSLSSDAFYGGELNHGVIGDNGGYAPVKKTLAEGSLPTTGSVELSGTYYTARDPITFTATVSVYAPQQPAAPPVNVVNTSLVS